VKAGVNYVPHVKNPVLLGGRHDYVMPLEESQKPLYRLRRALTPTPSPPLTPRNDDDIVL